MPDNIHIKLPDGSEKEVPKGTTGLDVAKSISPRLADAAIAAKARPIGSNGHQTGETPVSPQSHSGKAGEGARPTQELIDLNRPLDNDTELRILTEKDPEA